MRERTLFISAIVGIGLIAAGFAVATQANVMPPEASTRAVAVDQLFRILLGVSTVIFLLVEGALVFAVLRFRRRPGDDRPGPAIHGNTSLEILWTLIPAAISPIPTMAEMKRVRSLTSVRPPSTPHALRHARRGARRD